MSLFSGTKISYWDISNRFCSFRSLKFSNLSDSTWHCSPIDLKHVYSISTFRKVLEVQTFVCTCRTSYARETFVSANVILTAQRVMYTCFRLLISTKWRNGSKVKLRKRSEPYVHTKLVVWFFKRLYHKHSAICHCTCHLLLLWNPEGLAQVKSRGVQDMRLIESQILKNTFSVKFCSPSLHCWLLRTEKKLAQCVVTNIFTRWSLKERFKYFSTVLISSKI